MKFRSRTTGWLATLALSLLSVQVSAGVAAHPAVLELFTSQGCSSCPPADKVLAALADRPDVLALSYHITYWNDLGWRDPLSLNESTLRQNSYADARGSSQVYTPQAIVQGSKDVLGSDGGAVSDALATASVEGNWVPVSVTVETGKLRVIAASPVALDADLLLIGYLKYSQNKVPSGENAGTVAEHRNSVVSITPLGKWDGKAIDLAPDLPQGDGYAVLVQGANFGPILGGGWTSPSKALK